MGSLDLSLMGRLKSWFHDIKPSLRSPIFRKSLALIMSFSFLFFGLVNGFSYRAAEEYKRLMTVSAVNETTNFSVSGVSITFREQFISDSLFIIPFDISSFDTLSTDASTYEVWLQGIMSPIRKGDYRAKFILFGQSGSGVILIDGDFDGKPFNVYVHSTKEIHDVSELSALSNFELKRDSVTLTDLQTMELVDSNSTRFGSIKVNGHVLPASKDMAVVTVNPKADNVVPVLNLDFDMSVGAIYNATIGSKDRKLIETNRAVVADAKEKLKSQLEEFESRLERDSSLTATQVRAIKDADKYAFNATGSREDIEKINKILSKAGLSVSTSSNFLESGNTDRNRNKNTTVDVSQFTRVSGVDAQEGLATIRLNFMNLNAKLEGFDYQLQVVASIENDQDKVSTVMDNQDQVKVIKPF